jgi:hypothetical protein
MKMKLFAKLVPLVLAVGTLLAIGSPLKAGQPAWVITERVQFLKAVGKVPLALGSHTGNQLPPVKVIEQENAVQTSQHRDDQRWLNIYKSLSFLGGA